MRTIVLGGLGTGRRSDVLPAKEIAVLAIHLGMIEADNISAALTEFTSHGD